MYFEILISTRSKFHNRLFTYSGDDSYQVGDPVLVPFGKKQLHGYIFGVPKFVDESVNIKEIIAKNDILPKLSVETLTLVKWMAKTKYCLFIDCLELFFPPQLKLSKENYSRQTTRYIVNIQANPVFAKNATKQKYAFEILMTKQLPINVNNCGVPQAILQNFEAKGIITISEAINKTQNPINQIEKHQLNDEQQAAFNQITKQAGTFSTFLLEGATGSGKTEVYLQVIDYVIKNGKTALILVPEIALTHQVKKLFIERFGEEIIAWQNSSLTNTKRQKQWQKIADSQAKIVIGTRMGVFSPMQNIGCIIIDEEHDSAYKQENQPSYHAREVALARAKYHQAIVVLVSATPSIESYARAKIGKYQHIFLHNQASGIDKSKLEIIDMKKSDLRTQNYLLSSKLIAEIRQTISNDEQVMLLLNKRGYSQSIQCRSCGHIEVCPRCGVPLAKHINPERLKCHYCDYSRLDDCSCSVCNAKFRVDLRQGIQRLEEELLEIFPNIQVMRFDRDTSSTAAKQDENIARFRNKEAQVLIGTQMIAKGFDFPNVTLCGIINADTGLSMPNFRAREKQFQLIKQFIGRSGRHKPGKSLIQTFIPDDQFFNYLSQPNDEFYMSEISVRKQFDYPPFSKQVLINFSGKSDDTIIKAMRNFEKLWRLVQSDAILFGPTRGYLNEIQGRKYAYFIIKHHQNIEGILIKILEETRDSFPSIRITVNVDPMQLI